MPTAQFPNIVPPEILVQAIYPGGDAKTLEQAVATPIEQQMNGVDNMNYMQSTNASNGLTQLSVDFDVATNADTDQILSQLCVDQAQSQLSLPPSSFPRHSSPALRGVSTSSSPSPSQSRSSFRHSTHSHSARRSVPCCSSLKWNPKVSSLPSFFGWFNREFSRTTNGYVGASGWLVRKSVVGVVIILILSAFVVLLGSRLPGGFLPTEDQGYAFVALQLPQGTSLQRTAEAYRSVEDALHKVPGVESVTSVIGFSLLSFTQDTYHAFYFVTLKNWDQRKSADQQFGAIQQNLASNWVASSRDLRSLSRLPRSPVSAAPVASAWCSKIALAAEISTSSRQTLTNSSER